MLLYEIEFSREQLYRTITKKIIDREICYIIKLFITAIEQLARQ